MNNFSGYVESGEILADELGQVSQRWDESTDHASETSSGFNPIAG